MPPTPPLLFFSLPLPFPFQFPFPLFPFLPFPSPLQAGHLNTAKGLGSAVIFPSEVWSGAPTEIEFGAL